MLVTVPCNIISSGSAVICGRDPVSPHNHKEKPCMFPALEKHFHGAMEFKPQSDE